MKLLPLALLSAAILSLAGCSTEYGAMGFTGGVAAAPITNDVYRISARGNGFTDTTTVQDYVLLKAAETALGAGKTSFTILGGQDATTNAVGQTAGTMNSSVIGNSIYTTYNPGLTYNIVKPGGDVNIRVWSPGPNEAVPPNTFNAQQVFDNINPRVKRAKSS